MNSTSRHSRQGGNGEEETGHPDGTSEITEYEVQRNRRMKLLHDEVQKALIDLGFGEAAELRPLFTRRLAGKGGVEERTRNVSSANQKSLPREEDVHLRRSARNFMKADAKTDNSSVFAQKQKKVCDANGRPGISKCMYTECSNVGCYPCVLSF